MSVDGQHKLNSVECQQNQQNRDAKLGGGGEEDVGGTGEECEMTNTRCMKFSTSSLKYYMYKKNPSSLVDVLPPRAVVNSQHKR